MKPLGARLRHAWNAFSDREEETLPRVWNYGTSSGVRQDRLRVRISNERSIISAIYTRMAVDTASVALRHVRLDDQNRYLSDIDSGLNECLTVEANLDQGAQALRQDIAYTLFEDGVAAVVPVDTTLDPAVTGFDVKTLRVGRVVQWYPRHVRVSLYNEAVGQRQEIVLEKSFVALIENPFYSVMNEPNSTLQRLIHKLNLLDAVDEQSSSGKLDIIIQLPYTIRSEARRQQAEQRRKDIEFQLKGSQYGIAYTDGTEKITQLNRPAENNLWQQIQDLTNMVYGQLGITPEIMNGTADEAAMLNYMTRTIEPILNAIVEEMRRKFLTKTARSQKQSIMFFKDLFQLTPLKDIAESADKFTRNEIITSNEIRGFVGLPPSKDPKADQLVNSNMPQPSGDTTNASTDTSTTTDSTTSTDDDSTAIMNSAFDTVDKSIDDVFAGLGVDENG